MALEAVGVQTWIWNNNLKSIVLLVFFPLLLLGMAWSFFVALAYLHASQAHLVYSPTMLIHAGTSGIMQYGLYVLLATGTWFSIAFFTHESIINGATGARPVTREQAKDVYNILENLCISRGLPVPKLFIIETPVLNAYASGLGPGSFSVTLTTGIIQTLSREELETVIGHELTHIMNRDVRLLVISVVFVGMLSYLSQVSFRILLDSNRGRYRSSSDRDRGGGLAILLIAVVIFAIGYFLSLCVRFALSRKREFMADAGSVRLTKNPSALISALEKISGHSQLPAPEDIQQMFIDNDSHFLGMFATHPPIAARIAALKMMGGAEESIPQAQSKSPWS